MNIQSLKESVREEYGREAWRKMEDGDLRFLDQVIDRTLSLVREAVPEEEDRNNYDDFESNSFKNGHDACRTQFFHNLDILEGKQV